MSLTFADLKRNLKRENSSPRVRVALLGDTPTQLLAQALRGYAYEFQLAFELFEADYDQVERQIADPTSSLYEHGPEYAAVFESTQKLHGKFIGTKASERRDFARTYIDRVRSLVAALSARKIHVVWCNLAEPAGDVFGSFANKTELSFTYQVRAINYELMRLAIETKTLSICDISSMQAEAGKTALFSPTTYVSTGMVFQLEAWVPFAKRLTEIIAALRGRIRKALVLDLDNTVWGGVIGDDGIEGIEVGSLGIGRAFTELQLWAKQLQERGILLAVCSKNTEAIAKAPFEHHPEMVLRLSDIAVFVANWENKVDNIRHIRSVLNIGFDAMVFLDDNPVERDMVRGAIPELTVPELPADPADYAPFLYSLNLFETASFSEEDTVRTQQIRDDALRVSFQKTFANEDEYLASLEMLSLVTGFTAFNVPRVAQLSQRSNQFNLRTVRYTERDVDDVRNDPNRIGLTFTLRDKFGDHGLIAVVILKCEPDGSAFIDTWFMSCRVLKRGMEAFVLNTIASRARERGLTRIVGEYLPTAKNAIVKDHYASLGFASVGALFELNIEDFQPRPVHIRYKGEHE